MAMTAHKAEEKFKVEPGCYCSLAASAAASAILKKIDGYCGDLPEVDQEQIHAIIAAGLDVFAEMRVMALSDRMQEHGDFLRSWERFEDETS